MKKLSIFLIAIVAILSLNACSDDDDFTFTAKENPEGVMFLNSTADVYSLSAFNRDNLAERFVWNEVDFDVQTTVRYELQASTTPEFTDLTILASNIAETNYGVTVGNMLDLATEAGLDNDPDTDAPNSGMLYFRVRAYVGESPATDVSHLSDVLTIMVELPEDIGGEIELPMIYMVGSFQNAGGYGNDWTPADGVPLAASAAGKMDYEGFVYVNVDAPMFKFLPTNEGWDGDYGDAGDTDGVYTGVLLQDDESNAGTPDGTGGYYFVEVNTDKMTYDLTETNWGIIGNATPTGWDSDTDMIYDPATKVWSITLDLTAQEAPDNGIKFRANDAWDFNIGDDDADGTMEFGGQNIGIPEDGNYTITLDLSNPRNYTYSITKN